MSTYQEAVKSYEYMGLDPRQAWADGPVIVAARVSCAEAHKAHADALEVGDMESINTAWEDYCIARNALTDALHT